MKRILTTVFMVVMTMSAFATVDLQTTTKNLNPNECSPIGAMKFVVANPADFLQGTTTGGILIKVTLKGRTSLAPAWIKNQMPGELDGDPDPAWRGVYLDVDEGSAGAATWDSTNRPTVYWLADCADPYDYFFIWVPAGSIIGTPTANDDAWFAVSPDPAPSYHMYANPIRVDVSGLLNNENVEAAVEDFWLDSRPDDPYNDAWNILAQQVTNYQPSDPSVGLVRAEAGPVYTVTEECPLDKFEEPVKPNPVFLCKTYSEIEQEDPECYDGYRHGTICTFTVDFENLDEGMYVTLEPADPDTYIVLYDDTPTLQFGVTTNLAADAPEACDPFVDDGQDGQNIESVNEINCEGGAAQVVAIDSFEIDGFTYTHKVQIPINTMGDGYMTITGLELARHTTSGALMGADLNVGLTMEDCLDPCAALGQYMEFPNDGNPELFWRCCDCVADYGVKPIADVIDFLNCEEVLADLGPDVEVIYWTYFPKIDGKWWAGLSMSNTTPLKNFTGLPVKEQDIHAELYLIEADGDMFYIDWGYIVPGGIKVVAFEEGMPGLTPMQETDATIGDEQFWVVGVGTGTVPGTYITIDGFGMLGDGTQAQGFLSRTNVEQWWMSGINFGFNVYNK